MEWVTGLCSEPGGVPMQKGVGRGGTWRGWTLPLGTFGLGENALEWTTYH